MGMIVWLWYCSRSIWYNSRILYTLQGDSSPKRTVDEATDSSKNEKYGDDGWAKAKSEKQIKDLEQQKELAKNKREASTWKK